MKNADYQRYQPIGWKALEVIKKIFEAMTQLAGIYLNTTLPSSTLKKKHNAIAYHRVREAVAANVVKVNHIEGKENIADILTKATDGPTFRKHMKACLLKL
jgi:hypothetical protein